VSGFLFYGDSSLLEGVSKIKNVTKRSFVWFFLSINPISGSPKVILPPRLNEVVTQEA